ncbi:non-ribosomal peptide synthetase [Trichoderma barbatum]
MTTENFEMRQRMERELLKDEALKQAKILNLALLNDEPQWAVAISLAKLDDQEPADASSIIKRARKALRKLKDHNTEEKSPIPKKWTVLDELPINSKGEVDEKALYRLLTAWDTADSSLSPKEKRARIAAQAARADTHRIPQDEIPTEETELVLREFWARVLNLEPHDIGTRDNFLILGGDSINAIELVALAEQYGIGLTVTTIVGNPELQKMAAMAVLDQANDDMYNAEPLSLLPQMEVDAIVSEVRTKCGLTGEGIIQDVFPCTALQAGIMALSEKQPGSYMTRQIYELPNHIDIPRFKAAWEETVDRCDNLRTRVLPVNSQTIQAVVKGDTTWEETAGETIDSFVAKSKDIEMTYGTRLCRYGLVTDADGKSYFVWIIHHAIFDGLTARLVLDNFHQTYHSQTTRILRPYSSFIKYITAIDQDAARKFWKMQLQDARRANFPRNINTRSEMASRVMTREISFPYTAETSVTKATILRAAWAIVLARYCDTDDVCFGTTVSGRQAPVPGINQMTGFVIATVPIRIRLERGQSVAAFLQSIQAQASEIVPFEQYGLQNIARLGEDARDACDFSNLFVIQPAKSLASTADSGSKDAILLRGSAAEKKLSDAATQNYFNYPLVLEVLLDDDRVDLQITYDSNSISGNALEALFHHFEHVVQQLFQASDRPLSTVDATGKWDLECAKRFNPEVPEIVDLCIHQMFENQALRRPSDLAICAWDKSFTYRELSRASNRLAHHLLNKLSIQKEDLVHVCFEKSAWFIVAIIAINKAGAAWVPLDPSHPEQRLKQVVSQTRAKVALASSTYSSLCAGLVDSVVEVAIAKRLGMTAHVRMLQFSAYVFDVSVGEIVQPLITGACCCFIRDKRVSWPAEVPDLELMLFIGEAVQRDVFDISIQECYSAEESNLNIGRPVGAFCWIVDPADPQRLAPVGTVGEIVVQGPTTKEAIVTNVPDWAPYHLAYYNPDGTMEFLSRKDTQHHIQNTLKSAETGSQRATSKISIEDGITEIIGELSILLPPYMIPKVFIPCRYMPVLRDSTQRLSRQELAQYSLASNSTRKPETAAEIRMQQLWAGELKIAAESIGRDDSFLHLGGDSLVAIQLVTSARNVGLLITVKDIFEDPRLWAVSLKAIEIRPFSLLNGLINTNDVIETLKRQYAFPCTSLQEGSYIAKYMYQLPADVDMPKFKAAWEETVRICSNLRTRAILVDDTCVQIVISLDAYIQTSQNLTMGYGSRLCRYAIIREIGNSAYFALNAHHCVFDGWSLPLIFNTLSAQYHKKTTPKLMPYAHFVNYTMGLDRDAAGNYWRSQLQDAQPASFPSVDEAQSQNKVTLGSLSVTKASILRAAWAIVLSRYSDTEDICFGTIASAVPGLVVATVPIRNIHNQAIEMIPFEQYEAQKACDFTSLLVVQPAYTLNSSGNLYEKMLQNYLSYPLALQCYLGEDQVELELQALFIHFDNVVQQLCKQEDDILGSIAITSPWDLKYATELNPPIGIVEIRKRPNYEAVFATEQSLTYAELNRLSRAGPGVIVPFCMEKSLWTIVAMLAIMQSGGAYLPLDPSHPINRRRMIVEEVGASIIINMVLLSPSLIDDVSAPPQQAPKQTKICSPSNAAYVLFTSGSTGKPKGTIIDHSAACTNILDLGKTMGWSNTSRCLQFSSFTFDVSVLEIFSTLAFGGTVCVPSEMERLQSLPEFMRKANVDTAILTPSFAQIMHPTELPQLQTLALMGEPPTRDSLDTWCGHVRLINGYGPTEITVCCSTHEFNISDNPRNIGRPFNSACWIVEPNDYNKLAPIGCVGELVVQGHTVSRGYINEPEKTKQVFLSEIQFVSSGPHRFYLTGDLVRYNTKSEIEYLGRKDKQVKIRGQRLELGEIEASIRRVMPEITQVGVEVLRREAGDFLAAFISFKEDYKNPLSDNFIPLEQKMRERLMTLMYRLKEELPSYMVPKVTIPLLELPFNAAMKLDRGKLQASVKDFTMEQLMAYSLSERDRVAPTTEMELKLQCLWARVLKIEAETIGKNDHFFQTGGDSLSAIRLSSLANQHGIKLSVATIFADSKLSAMAAAVSEGDAENDLQLAPFSLLPFEQADSITNTIKQMCDMSGSQVILDIYPCTAFQEGLMALAVTRPGSYIAKNIYKVPAHLDVTMFKAAWERTMELCDNLRTRIVSVNGVCLQVVLDHDTSWDTASSSDIQSILEDKNGEVYFFWTIHHAIFDGWSLGIIVKTLTAVLRNSALPTLYPAANEYWLNQLQDAKRASFPSPPSRRQPDSELKKTSVFTSMIELPVSTRSSITKATIMRTAWAMILAKYSDSNDVCFATTVSGVTIATVPVRIRIDHEEKLDGFLDRIQIQASEMVAYEHPQIKEACDFSSLMAVQPAEDRDPDSALISFSSDEKLAEESLQNYFTYPLILHCFLGEGTVTLAFIYDSSVLAESQIRALSFQFDNVIQQLIVSGHRRYAMACVHTLIDRVANTYSDLPAVSAWDANFTYKELETITDRLANYLISFLSVKIGDIVHVCFEKSAWYVVATLAINKAGATWSPFDPSHPHERHQQIISQTGASLALASPGNVSRFTAKLNIRLIKEVTPQHAAYIIFTSGSTGTPKGVVIEHGTLCSSQTAISKRLGYCPGVRMLQFASYVFDASVGETINPLISGACVCIPSWETRMNSLAKYIEEEQVNWAFFTPSLARTLQPSDVPSLKLLIIGGELVGRDLISAWGPTETCVYGALYEWKSLEESQQTIGQPVGGFCWIVDPNDSQKLAPIGTLGEIVVQDAKKTAAAVIKAPDWAPYRDSKHWSRFYKTGDLATYNPDGTIRYHARKDMQVKIRGLRVELGEIEHHIYTGLDGVCQVAVDVLKPDVSSSSLVAFVCFNDDTIPAGIPIPNDLISSLPDDLKRSFQSLRERLNAVLPTYMIPTLFIPCKAMPLATSTKMDRKMLLGLVLQLDRQVLNRYTLGDEETTKEVPESDMERCLQELWSDILNIPQESIYRDSNFLGIGGDSVAAIRLVSFARDRGIQLTVSDVFEDPRLCAVAGKVRLLADGVKDSSIYPFSLLEQHHQKIATGDSTRVFLGLPDESDVEDAYPCSKLQEGLMALAVKQPGSYIAKFIYRLSENTDVQKFKDAWERTVKIATNLRTRIIQEDVSWDIIGNHPLEVYLHELQNVQMNYGSRLRRDAILRDDINKKTYFILTLHHAIFDGWSIRNIFNILQKLYNGLNNYTLKTDNEAAVKYWTTQLQGAKQASFPPKRTNLDSGVTNADNAGIVNKMIGIPTIASPSITMATILRAAWAIVLARYCEAEDICFGATVSGPIIATIPVRLRTDPKQSVSEFLHYYEHNDAKDACEFSSLFNIMVATEEGKNASAFHNYFSYPLIIQGHIYESQIEIPQLVALSHQLEHVVQQLATQTDLVLGDQAIKFNPEIPDVVDLCVHHLIEKQAIVRPNALAIDAWDGRFTYQINIYGIKTGDLVHVCFEKTAWYIISILAINKAGATWVPLDPSHPVQRLAQIVSQTKATTVLTSPTNAAICKALFSTTIEVTESLNKQESPRTNVSPRDGVYMLFTSGSTGTPKGFLMEHGAVSTSQFAIGKRLRHTPEARVLQFASYVFDMCIGEIILSLITGSCVCIPSDHTRMNGLANFIRDMRVTWLWSTPSFIRTIKPVDIPNVEVIVLAGEAVPRDVLGTWFGNVRLLNAWGPAETCVCSTLHEFTSSHESSLTVGRPVGGLCWIVDPEDSSKLSPIGTIGEIIIQGPTLLREYLGDHDRTKKTIMTSLPEWAPYRDSQHWNRLYKSGDLGCYNPDGTIEFSARKDTQVKIRGLRVELTKQVAVDVFKSVGGAKLVAYFSLSGQTRTVDDGNTDNGPFLSIDDKLQSRLTAIVGKLTVALPRYMVPTLFIPCGYMPQDLALYSLILLQKVWAEILDIPMDLIGRDDSFLALGDGILLTAKNIFDDPHKTLATQLQLSGSQVQPGVDIGRFKSSWDETIKSCGMLRSRLVLFDGTCIQVVIKDDNLWGTSNCNLADALERNKSLRMTYDGNNYFLWTMHHSIHDGWTIPLILQTFNQAYHERMPFIPQPFSKFIYYLSQTDESAAREYWTKQLANAKQAAFPAARSVSRSTNLSSSLITKATVLRAAWAIVLARYCESNDICFGSTISGRQALVDVPIRIQIDREQLVSDFLRNVQRQATDMAACEFSSLMVVQPIQQVTEDSDLSESILQNYYTYPLVIQGHIHNDCVELMEALARQFSRQKLDHFALQLNSDTPIVVDSCVHTLISQQARRTPNALAQANFIHVCFEKSLWYIVAILAVNKIVQQTGATLTISSDVVILGPELHEKLQDQSYILTRLKLTSDIMPPLFHGACFVASAKNFPAFPQQVLSAWFGRLRLYNAWGPAETSVDFDSNNPRRLAPIGCPGEFVVQAAIVTDLPDWVPNHATKGWDRFYKTGDLGYYGHDGNLHFVSREIEHQIRSALSNARQISVDVFKSKAAVHLSPQQMLEEDGENLFMTMTDDLRATLNGLVDALNLALPRYMIPTLFIPLNYIPFITSAKLDRWNQFALLDGTRKRGPETTMESSLQTIWANVLSIPAETIGRDDSFLRIGGDSIGAIQLVSLAHSRLCSLASKATHINLPAIGPSEQIQPFSLLSHSVKTKVLDASRRTEFGLSEKEVIQDAYPFRQQGSYFAKHLFKLPPHVDVQLFKSAWEQTIASCSNLRTKIILVDNVPIQIQLQDDPTWETVYNSLESYNSCQNTKINYNSTLCSYGLFQDKGHSFFALNMHHAIFDGWTAYHGADLPRLEPYSKFVKYRQLHEAKPAKFAQRLITTGDEQTTAILEQKIPTVLRAAWSIVLAQYCDTDDVCFGSVVSATVPVRRFLQDIQSQALEMVPLMKMMQSFFNYPLIVQCNLLDDEFSHVVQQLLAPDELLLENRATGYNSQKIELALRDPNHEALYSTEASMSYGELDHLSTLIANHLRLLKKSIWAIIAMTGILKSGAAFVPLDPSHPRARLEAIIKETNANIMITSPNALSSCRGLVQHIVELSPSLKSEHAVSKQSTSDTAYPKGVVIQHFAICTNLISLGKVLRTSPSSRIFHFAGYVFDAMVYEIFVTLAYDAPAFIQKTILPSQVPTLRTLIVGGEPLSKDIIEIWHGKGSIVATMHEVRSSNDGRCLTPIGCVGELRTRKSFSDRLNLVRYTPDGLIEYVGRKDLQYHFKCSLTTVEHVVVDVLQHKSGMSLVAFISLTGETTHNTYVKARVPPYMMPTSMKMDRRKLLDAAASLAEPATEMEKKLIDLSAQILRIDACEIGRHDKFLEIGGAGISLTVADIFKESQMSVFVTHLEPFTLLPLNKQESLLSEISTLCGLTNTEFVEDAYPCTQLQQGLMALSNIYKLPQHIDIICSNLRTRIVLVDTMAIQKIGGDHYFSLTMHHSIFDGWSMSSIMAQYARFYWLQQLHDAKSSIIRAADICFGATVSGRNAALVGANSMPGVMLATVPVRVRLDKDQTFGLPNITSLGANAKDACNFSSLLSQSSDAILIDESSEQDMEDRIQNFINYPLVVQALLNDNQVEIAVAVSEQFDHVIQQLLSNPEQKQAIRWNTASLETTDECVHDLHEAIYFTGGSMTYAELDLLSSQLAIFLPMLGILKAGGAFIPLDPSHPIARRQALIDEVGAQVMIVSSSTTKIANTATPTNAAYMLFTSGSTGKPKGVIAFNTDENSRWFQFANYVFDACITEIFAALTAGGTVCFIMDAQTLILGDLRNAYGPAEAYSATIIGHSDDYQQLAPIGSRGYFKDEVKTKSSFVEDFRRFYKTGDLIKIRGQRIELENSFEHVAVDVIHERSLTAFVSFRSGGHKDGATGSVEFQIRDDAMGELFSQLLANMSRILPQHMMPSYIIPVMHMPHNSAGKLDRKLLLQTAAAFSIDDLAQYLSGQRTIFRDCSSETEFWIRSQWADVLNLPAESISVDDNFYQLGGDSIRIVTLAKSILNEYEVTLGLSILNSKHTTVSSIAKFIENARENATEGRPIVDLMEKIQPIINSLSASNLGNLAKHPIVKLSKKSTVFLTGATGFLGTELLRQLLRHSSVKSVIALVRCKSPQHGLERIRATAQAARWWHKQDAKRIEIWVGDLGKSQLGLDASQWERLSGVSRQHRNVHVIVHNGAVVNWNADYDKLVAPNVSSTIDLLNAAASSPVNPRFVFVSGGLKTDPDENPATLATHLGGLNGYVQTKFVCETVIQDVVKRLPKEQNRLSIVKPGRIIGSESNGVANVDDLIWRVVSGAAAIHAYPVEPLENWMYIADVDSVASAVLKQVFQENPIDSFVHVTGGMPTPVFWEKVNEELKIKCKPVSWAEWKESAHASMAEVGDKHPLWPVQHFLGALGAPRSIKELATETLEHEQWHKAVKKNVQYLMEIGFIASSVGEMGNVKDGAIKRLH